MIPTTSLYIDVKHSKIHGTGVFAKTDIPEGTLIIEYVGEKITKKEADRRYDEKQAKKGESDGSVYIFTLNSRYDVDGDVEWNTAKFINHTCNPNCETEIIKGHIWIMAARDIKVGEELSYDYGYDMEDYHEHPCRCGCPNCVGYIVDQNHWPKLKKKLMEKGKV